MTSAALFAPPGAGWINCRDPRLRIVTALLFALITVSLTNLDAVLAAFLLAAILTAELECVSATSCTV
jgi:cobalt/nickel transport system permease protein